MYMYCLISGKSWNQSNSNLILSHLMGREDVSLTANNDGIHTATITVPNRVVGAIIGRGGSRISEIRAKSLADISIGQMNKSGQLNNSHDRLITVKGFLPEVQNACVMICKW